MDSRNFDDLARKLATGVSRRSVLRGFIGGGAALGGLRGTRALAASKITVCHFPPGNAGNVQVIEVGSKAVSEHLAHGDTIYGNCCLDSDCVAMNGDCGVLVGCQADGSGTSSCVYSDDSTICDDLDACNGVETCFQSYCVPGTPMDCSGFGNQCNVGVCSGGQCGPSPLDNGTGCSTGNMCTTGDACQDGACSEGSAVACEAPGECWTIGECDPASGCPDPQFKGTGTPCGTPPSCDGNTAYPGDFCSDDGDCAPGTATECGAGQECVNGLCESTCREPQDSCAAHSDCCNGLCEEVRSCGADGQLQCCVSGGVQCSESCDCCNPYSCVGSVCCGNLQGLECDDEQQPCCAGFQCLNGTCQLETCAFTGDACNPENIECCQDEPTECHTRSCGAGSVTLDRCCHPTGGTCNVDCDCCPGLVCEGGHCRDSCHHQSEGCFGDSDICCDGLRCIAQGTFAAACCSGAGADCPMAGQFTWVIDQFGDLSPRYSCCTDEGLVCGAGLTCETCGGLNDTCTQSPIGSHVGSTCCVGLFCNRDGVCTNETTVCSDACNSDLDCCDSEDSCVAGACCRDVGAACVPGDPFPCCSGLSCAGEWPNGQCV